MRIHESSVSKASWERSSGTDRIGSSSSHIADDRASSIFSREIQHATLEAHLDHVQVRTDENEARFLDLNYERQQGSNNVKLAQAEHEAFARLIASQSALGGLQMVILAGGYEIIKALLHVLGLQQKLQLGSSLVSDASLESFIAGVEGTVLGHTDYNEGSLLNKEMRDRSAYDRFTSGDPVRTDDLDKDARDRLDGKEFA